MGLVAVTVAFSAAGAYIGRDLTGGIGIAFFIAALACVFGLNVAAGAARAAGRRLLFGLGLLLGLGRGAGHQLLRRVRPGVVWQSAGATAAFVGGLGAYGYATRRDFSNWARALFWLLLALIVSGSS